MNHRIEFKSNKSIEELKRETLEYFQEQGFKKINSTVNSLNFERGSVLRNMLTFNPLKWKSSIKIKFYNGKVTGDFEINTIHQAVTIKEERLWETFISNYQKSIETGKSLNDENQLELKATKKSSWKYIGYAILGAVTFGIPSGVIAYLTGFDFIVTAGAVGGALTLMMYKIEKDKDII